MKIAITGANGKVGTALIDQLDNEKFAITSIDLPNNDVSDLEELTAVTDGHDALIHLAWKGIGPDLDTIDPINGIMFENAYRAAVANNIGLVIMGSSNHARNHNEREEDGKIRYTDKIELANNMYGVEKQKMEAMGRYYAHEHGLKVIAIRIGNINPEDTPRPDIPTRWMSHRDFARLITLALTYQFEPGHFEVVYGVSRQAVFDWKNTFGYEPKDEA